MSVVEMILIECFLLLLLVVVVAGQVKVVEVEMWDWSCRSEEERRKEGIQIGGVESI